jgi:putative SOS response-associated peptidase YedK
MPCIVGQENYLRWLDPDEPAKSSLNLLQPYSSEKMRAWRVGKAVGNVRKDDATLIAEMTGDAVSENYATPLLWEQN